MNRFQRRAVRKRQRDAQLGVAVDMLRDEDRLEKAEQREVVRLYEKLGCWVVSFSQPRATMQTEGVPDLMVFCYRKRRAWFHETKRRVDGKLEKQRAEQVEFEKKSTTCGIDYVCGGFSEARAYLEQIGVIRT
jgi:hypothetical protein